MKISVDRDRCIGAGQCAMTAPEVFDQREEDGVVVLLAVSPPEAEQAGARNAAVGCPATAITIDDD